MTPDEAEVKAVHPTARCVWHPDIDKFKVYYTAGECRVALSSAWDSQSMAWAEAAALLRGKQQVQQVG